jgi:hypothetical protein
LKKHRRVYWNIFSLLTTVVVMVLHNSELSLLKQGISQNPQKMPGQFYKNPEKRRLNRADSRNPRDRVFSHSRGIF